MDYKYGNKILIKTLKYLRKNNIQKIAALMIKKHEVFSFARIESTCLFSFGLSLRIKSTSKIKQWSLL